MFGRKKKLAEPAVQRISGREYDRFMGRVYKMVSCHRDGDAIFLLLQEYDYLQTHMHEFETLFKHVEQWGPSRTLLCLARLIIYRPRSGQATRPRARLHRKMPANQSPLPAAGTRPGYILRAACHRDGQTCSGEKSRRRELGAIRGSCRCRGMRPAAQAYRTGHRSHRFYA